MAPLLPNILSKFNPASQMIAQQNAATQMMNNYNNVGGYAGLQNIANTQNTGGSGGGGQPQQSQQQQSSAPAAPQGFTTPEGNWYQGSMDQYNAEIDSSYNAGMGAWNVAEQNANKDLTAITDTLNSGQTADSAQLNTDRGIAQGQLDAQNRAGQTRKEDAMAAARRLYSELQMANRQRFGGSSSAGGGAQGIQGAELQRQQGSTNRQANEFFQQVETAKQDVESKYNSGLLQIKQKTTELLTQAKLNFSNMITQIAQGRAQTEQQKSSMRINALMALRNEAFQVQQQKVLAEQQLTQMREASRLNIEAYRQTTGNTTAQTGQNYNTLASSLGQTPQMSNVGQGNQTSTANTNVGQITPTQQKTGNWWDSIFKTVTQPGYTGRA